MRRLYVVLFLMVLSLVLALQTGHGLLYRITYLIAVTVLLSGIWTWFSVRGVRLERQTRTPHTQVGQRAEEHFVVHNSSRFPKLWLEVRDHSDLPDHRASFVINKLGPGERYGWAVRTLCQRRGRFTLGPVTLTSGDPFDLFEATHHLQATSSVLVVPAALPMDSLQLVHGRAAGGDAVRGRTHEITTNVATVRNYAPGDAFKRIHWPSTARKSRIIIKEFELDPTEEVWLFLDLARRAQSGPVDSAPLPEEPPLFRSRRYVWEPTPNTEEYGIILTASLARYFVDRNRAVGLVTYGPRRQWQAPVHSPRQLDRILELLALARARGEVPFQRVLENEGIRLGRNGLACVISSSPERDWVAAAGRLARRGPQVVVFFIDPTTFDERVDSGDLLGSLQASGLSAFTLGRGGVGGGQVLLSRIGSPAR